MTLGTRLRALRVKKAESLQEVANAIDASKAHVWELETGRSTNPSIDLLRRLAKHFEVSIAQLVGEDGEVQEAAIKMFGREFEDLSDEDWDFLRSMAKKLKNASGTEPSDER